MCRGPLHSQIFSPDGAFSVHIMAELAIGLKRLRHSVTVLSMTPHYNLIPMGRNAVGSVYFGRQEPLFFNGCRRRSIVKSLNLF